MIREGRFGMVEGICLLLWITLSKIYFSYASGIIKENRSAGWLAVLFGCLAGLIGLLPLIALLKRYPGIDLIGISKRTMGGFWGNILAGGIVFSIFFSTALILRQISETIIGTALPQAPLVVIMTVFTLIMAASSYLGLESIARTAVLLTPFILIGGIALFQFQWGNMDFDYLAPLWGPGMGKLALNSALRSSLLGDLVSLGFIAPALPRAKIGRIGVIAGSLAALLLTMAMITTQAIFPPPVAATHAYPFYEIARSIYFGRFFQRFEFLYVFVWIMIANITLAANFYFAATGLAKIFQMPYYQPLIPMMALAAVGAGLLFPN